MTIERINELVRTFERFTGDGLPNAPTNAPLPIGDISSGPHVIFMDELREAILLAANLGGGATDVSQLTADLTALSASHDATVATVQGLITDNTENKADIATLQAFVGIDGSGTGPAVAPGATTNFVGVPEAGGIRWTWTPAEDNGSPLTKQVFRYEDENGEINVIEFSGVRAVALTLSDTPGLTITPSIQAFNNGGAGPEITAAPQTTWRLPGLVTALNYGDRGLDYFEVNFTPAESLDTPLERYFVTVTSGSGDGGATAFSIDPSATTVRAEIEVGTVTISAVNAAGTGSPASFGGSAAAVPAKPGQPNVTAIAGGVSVDNPGLSADNGLPIQFGTITIIQ